MVGLRIILFDGGDGLCLFVRLPEGRRLLVDCGRNASGQPVQLLREMGQMDRLHPLDEYLRPFNETPEVWRWLGFLSLLRGLVLRPGGSWIFWRHEESAEPGFCLRAHVAALRSMPCPPEGVFPQPPILVMGLTPEEVLDLGGTPGAWVRNCSLAVRLRTGGADGHLLVGGDLRTAAWQRILADQGLKKNVRGVRLYATGPPPGGFDLNRGLLMAALPWLLLGLMNPARRWGLGDSPGGMDMSTPAVGMLQIDVDNDGSMVVRGMPKAANTLRWQGTARLPQDSTLPAPWPVRRALAGN